VGRPPYPRTVAEFKRFFPDERACLDYLTACRWPDGFRCPRCGYHAAFPLPRRRLWQCKSCGYQVSVTAGTILHRTKTPLLTWFWAAYRVTAHKPGLSALQLQRMLGLPSYGTAWLMLHKLRRAMVDAAREPLSGTIEIAETFIGGEQPGLRGGPQLTDRKAVLVAVAVEGKGKGKEPGRCRIEVIPDASASTLSGFIVRNVKQGSTILSDGHRDYQGERGVVASGYAHLPRTQASFRLAGTEDVVPHAHRAISNLKAWLVGTHRGVGADHLPAYLDEFVFRWNRRHSPMAGFQTLLGLGTHREPSTYEEILGPRPGPETPRRRGRKTGVSRDVPRA
jgi:ISXO2-like transposase domain/Transposase zinc-ribbon domain